MYRMNKKSLYVPLPNLACRLVHASHMPYTMHNNTEHTHTDIDSAATCHLWVSYCTTVQAQTHMITKEGYDDFAVTLYKVRQPKLKTFCLELLHSFLTCLRTVPYYSFNPEDDILKILTSQQLRKKVRSTEDSASITSSTHTDSMIISHYLRPSHYYNDFQRSQHK
jgi:hypothetical protein